MPVIGKLFAQCFERRSNYCVKSNPLYGPQVRTAGLFLTKIHFQEEHTMKAKRITSLILALALALSLCLTGCGSQGEIGRAHV